MGLAKWLKIALPAVATGLGWGLRGCFGHEQGALVPGALAGLALSLSSDEPEIRRQALRLGAVGASACYFGGEMTYGQTLGLTLRPARPADKLRGYLGLAVKGAAWLGLVGASLGMAASRKRPSTAELLALAALLYAAHEAGIELLNRPHRPPGELPAVYFSDRRAATPRPESWGGLWAALLVLAGYLAAKRDAAALELAGRGILGGGLGFPAGQALQAWGLLHKPLGTFGDEYVDWWKVMELAFGTIAGAALGVGFARVKRRPAPASTGALPRPLEGLLHGAWLLSQTAALCGSEASHLPERAAKLTSFPAWAGLFGADSWPEVLIWGEVNLLSAVKLTCHQLTSRHLAWPLRHFLPPGVLLDGLACRFLGRKLHREGEFALAFLAWEQTVLALLQQLEVTSAGEWRFKSKSGALTAGTFAGLSLLLTLLLARLPAPSPLQNSS